MEPSAQEVQKWLRATQTFPGPVKGEIEDVIIEKIAVAEVADECLAEAWEYPAMAMVGVGLADDLIEVNPQVQVAEVERFSYALAVLAVKRSLDKSPEDQLQEVDEIAALNALFDMVPAAESEL